MESPDGAASLVAPNGMVLSGFRRRTGKGCQACYALGNERGEERSRVIRWLQPALRMRLACLQVAAGPLRHSRRREGFG